MGKNPSGSVQKKKKCNEPTKLLNANRPSDDFDTGATSTQGKKVERVFGSQESLISMASNASGVLSEDCTIPNQDVDNTYNLNSKSRQLHTDHNNQTPTTNVAMHIPIIPTAPTHARLNLKDISNNDIPDSTRKVLLTSTDPSIKLSRMNPCRIKAGIDKICGTIVSIEHQRSGSLLITTSTFEQVQKLLAVNLFPFPPKDVTVNATVSWESQFAYRKFYAPEFADTPMDELLNFLQPFNVVTVRKLFSDPRRTKVPLFVATFIGQAPLFLLLGYCKYPLEKYVPSPRRCGKCYRYGHNSTACRGVPLCRRCGSRDHLYSACSNPTPSCINCRGTHEATSHDCPAYAKECQVCTVQAEQGISFNEARALIRTSPTSAFTQPINSKVVNLATNTTTAAPSMPDHSFRPLVQPAITPYNTHSNSQLSPNATNTQDSLWITPGQRCSKTANTVAVGNSQLSLPPLTPSRVSASFPHVAPSPSQDPASIPHDFHVSPIPSQISASLPYISQSPLSTPRPRSNSNSQLHNNFASKTLSELIISLLPIIIKLILADSTPTKVECLTTLGHILQADNVVADTLSSLQNSDTLSSSH